MSTIDCTTGAHLVPLTLSKTILLWPPRRLPFVYLGLCTRPEGTRLPIFRLNVLRCRDITLATEELTLELTAAEDPADSVLGAMTRRWSTKPKHNFSRSCKGHVRSFRVSFLFEDSKATPPITNSCGTSIGNCWLDEISGAERLAVFAIAGFTYFLCAIAGLTYFLLAMAELT